MKNAHPCLVFRKIMLLVLPFYSFREIKSAWTLAIQLFKVDYLLVCSDDNRQPSSLRMCSLSWSTGQLCVSLLWGWTPHLPHPGGAEPSTLLQSASPPWDGAIWPIELLRNLLSTNQIRCLLLLPDIYLLSSFCPLVGCMCVSICKTAELKAHGT